jgi:hypothetical protein
MVGDPLRCKEPWLTRHSPALFPPMALFALVALRRTTTCVGAHTAFRWLISGAGASSWCSRSQSASVWFTVRFSSRIETWTVERTGFSRAAWERASRRKAGAKSGPPECRCRSRSASRGRRYSPGAPSIQDALPCPSRFRKAYRRSGPHIPPDAALAPASRRRDSKALRHWLAFRRLRQG